MNHQSSLWSDALRRLLANKAAVTGGLVLLILIVLAIFTMDCNPIHTPIKILT